MTHFPPSELHHKRARALRIVGMVLSGLLVATVIVIFAFIVRSESAHDEQACPFAKREERALGTVRVIEEARSCVPEAEEHRWLVAREGKAPYELARRRLPKKSFAEGRTTWRLSEDEKKLLVLTIEVAGQPNSEFHEADVN